MAKYKHSKGTFLIINNNISLFAVKLFSFMQEKAVDIFFLISCILVLLIVKLENCKMVKSRSVFGIWQK